MKVVRIEQEGWLAVVAFPGRHFQLHVLMRDVGLLVVHPTTAASAGIRGAVAGKRDRDRPYNPHELSTDDRVAAIGADAEVKGHIDVVPGVEVPDARSPSVKVY